MINIKNFKSDYLYLIWKNPQNRSRYKVGTLKKNSRYEFKYSDNIQECIEHGFDLLVSFPDIKKNYISNKLFPEFLSRIPGPTRVDINEILQKYNLETYDAFELIKRSGAKTSLDTLEFIDPILNLKDNNIIREFYIAGTRHYCTKEIEEKIKIGDTVVLEPEPNNEYDTNAIKMLINNIFVGYVPNYYSQIITQHLYDKKNNKYICTLEQKTGKCEECLKVKLILKPTI